MEKNFFVKANGIEIFVKKAGAGYPLIFLHGNGETHEIFQNQIAFFQQNYQVIAIDTRGHGQSKNDKRPLSITLFVSDLKEVLDALNIKKAHIVGFSDGGSIALQFAATHHYYVDKLIVVGANTTPSGLKFSTRWWVRKEYYESKLRSIFLKKYKEKANILQLMIKHPHITRDELQLIRAYTLLLVGEDDVITKRHLKYMQKNIKRNLFHVIPNASHFFILEYPKLFNDILSEFIKTDID